LLTSHPVRCVSLDYFCCEQGIHKEFLAFQDVSNTAYMSPDHYELHILMAESAFGVEEYSISKEIVDQFFRKAPQRGQFYCRGKQLKGLLIDYEARNTNGAESIRQRRIALAEVLDAMSVATNSENGPRYRFLVYNISSTCWTIVCPFLRAGRAKYFVNEVSAVSNALEQSNDPDINWRIMFLSATATCLLDDGQLKAASETIDKAVAHKDKMLSTTLATEKVFTCVSHVRG
jgi:hypothetical protein